MQLESYPIRTDLALESQERLKKDHRQVKGVRLEEEKKDNGVVISTVFIDTENAAKAMGRPRGTYVTIEAPEMIEEDAGYHRDISVELAQILRQMVSLHDQKVSDDLEEGMDVSVLIAGLGNREVTPDALGPKVVDHLFITRHIINEFGHYAFSDEKTSRISGIVPRCDGADRNGVRGDPARHHQGDGAGFHYYGGCTCGPECEETESYNTAYGYRDYAWKRNR